MIFFFKDRTCLTSFKRQFAHVEAQQKVARSLRYVGFATTYKRFSFPFMTESNFFWSTVLILFTDPDNNLKLEALIRFMVVLSCYGCYEKKKPILYFIFNTC